MLIGEYSPSMDDKYRFIFPVKLREELGLSFVITKGLDGCLVCYSLNEWAAIEEKIRALPMSQSRSIQRYMFSSAAVVEPDKQGRVLIPQNLREHANLRRELRVIGASTHAEVWDAEAWEKASGALDSDTIEQAMDKLGF